MMKWHRPLTGLASLRLKYLLLVILILGAIFFALAYLGIHKARQSLQKIMLNQGRALIESLTLSAGNAIQAGLLLESLSESEFVELAQSAQQRLYGRSDADLYRQFRDEHSLLSVDILDSSLVVTGSDRWASGYRPPYPPEVAAEIHDIRLMGGGYRALTIHGDSLLPVVQYFVYVFEPGGALVVMTAPADYLDQITRQIGIGYLIRRISQQAGIDYILLQSRDGIIFASRQVQPVFNIASDPFLETLLAADTIGWRRHYFEGEEVLEIARRFESVEYPPGVFRLGLSLDEYHTISRGYDRQIIAIAAGLFLLTLLVVAVVSINQNYFILDQTFKRMRSLTETIFDRFSGAVLAYDADGKIIAINRALTELCGLDAGIIGRKLTEVAKALPFDLSPPVEPGQKAVSVEKDITTISGQRMTVLMGVSALPAEAGGGAVWLIQDVTEQKRLSLQFRHLIS